MANQQTTEFALLEASPPGIADRQLVGAASVTTHGSFEWVTPSDTDTLQICRVPVDSTLISLKLGNDDFGTTLTVDVGFYEAGEPGAVINSDALCTALPYGTAVTEPAEVRYEVLDQDTTGEFMWELAGLSERPSYNEMDIVFTVTAETSAVTATATWIVQYTL